MVQAVGPFIEIIPETGDMIDCQLCIICHGKSFGSSVRKKLISKSAFKNNYNPGLIFHKTGFSISVKLSILSLTRPYC